MLAWRYRRAVIWRLPVLLPLIILATAATAAPAADRPRFRDAGFAVGALPAGPGNAITDVPGVRVGQVTRIEGDSVRTGVTAILPHAGNVFQDKVPAAFYRANGFGKFAGSPQIDELGEIESPIILTNTLNVAEGIAGAVEWTLSQPGNEQVRSVNAIVGETNDGYLNDIRGRHVTKADVTAAITGAVRGPVAEGSVGAGTGTQAFQYKGGIGTSSRRLPQGWTVGVLVQTNYGGTPAILGVPIPPAPARTADITGAVGGGSIVMVIATDAPMSDRNLGRLAKRAVVGLSRTGTAMENGSGDFVVAFSTAADVRRTPERRTAVASVADVPNDGMNGLFVAVADATEEAIYNAIFKATAVTGSEHTLEPIDLQRVIPLLKAKLSAVGQTRRR